MILQIDSEHLLFGGHANKTYLLMDLSAFKLLANLMIEGGNFSAQQKIKLKCELENYEPEHPRIVSVKSSYSETLIIDLSCLLSVEAKGKNTLITMLFNGHISTINSKHSLSQMEKILCCSDIMKVHGSYLVNLKMCKAFHKSDQQLETVTDHHIPVSRDIKPWMGLVLDDLI